MPAKGCVLSPESVAQMKQQKLRTFLSGLNWIIAEPYMDAQIDNGSANRKKKPITLREFKALLDSGQSVLDIRKNSGISKTIVQFFCNFLQGKIKLTKEEFEREYLSGMELEEIANKHSITREDISVLRQMYGIKRKGATFINRKQTEMLITDEQRQIIYGSLMGDAKKVSSSAIGFGHSTKQTDYLVWKYEKMIGIRSEDSLKNSSTIDKRSGNIISDWRFYTKANSDIEKIIEQFYKTGTKEVTLEILNNLTPLSIAVWYMDDGSTDLMERKANAQPVYSFCTDSFSLSSCCKIVDWFLDRYLIKTYLRQRGCRKEEGTHMFRIIVDIESNEKFKQLIQPYLLPMFEYKIRTEEYINLGTDYVS